MRFSYHASKKAGFTLIEMLIVAPIVMIAIGILVTVMVVLTNDILQNQAESAAVYDTQAALNQIEQDVKLSGAFLATNDLPLLKPQGSNDNTADFINAGSSFNNLILRSFTTDKSPFDPSRKPIYTKAGAACGTTYTSNPLYTVNVVYYINNNNQLIKRVLARNLARQTNPGDGTTTRGPTSCGNNPASANVVAPWQAPTCSDATFNANNVTCSARDTVLMNNIKSLDIKYYVNASASSPNAVASDSTRSTSDRATALGGTDTAEITITTSKMVSGKAVTNTATLRATKLNVTADKTNFDTE